MEPNVNLTIHDGWAEVLLNRPERKNAITGPLGVDLAAALGRAQADDSVQVVLLAGAGGAFCSGLDIKEFNADPAPEWLGEFSTIWRQAHKALFECSKPIVCALERYAINWGAALAFASDILIVGEGAFLQVGEVRQGMAAPYNLAWLALRYPQSVSAPLTLLGHRCSGPELLQRGIAHECVADAQVRERAQALAQEMGAYPPGACARIKQGLRCAGPVDADTWFDQFVAVDTRAARQAPQIQK